MLAEPATPSAVAVASKACRTGMRSVTSWPHVGPGCLQSRPVYRCTGVAADGSLGVAEKRLLCSPGLVSTTYTMLERGNLSGVSDSVLDAIANALQLDESERVHLANLARASNPAGRPRRRPSSQLVRAPVQQILNAMPGAPAAHLPVASPQPGRTEGSSVIKALEGRPHEAVTSAPAESQQRTLLRQH